MNFYDDLVMQTQMNYSRPACPLPVVEIFTTRTTTLTANTSALLPRSTTSKVLLQG